LNTELALQKLDNLKIQQSDLLKWCENIQITNTTEQKRCEELNADLKIYKKQAEQMLAVLLAPSKDEISEIKAQIQPHLDELTRLINATNKLLADWRKEQLSITEGTVLQRATDYWDKRKAAEKTGEIVPLPDLGVTEPEKTSHHNMGSTGYRPKIIVKILKPNLIPREYCVPSESLLRMAGEMALKRKESMPIIEGAILEVDYSPVSRGVRQ
jgi:ElaB/YqjD/DUF883 family membrane-anchored ribosome-binding protein